MNYSLRDIFITLTFVALFLGTSLREPMGVIWTLMVFSVASISALVLGAEAATYLLSSLRRSVSRKSVRPLMACMAWKRNLIHLAVILFMSVSVVTANYVINEASEFNPMLFLSPAFGIYVGWRILGP